MGTEHTIHDGDRTFQVVLYEPQEVQTILNAVAGAEQYVSSFPCAALQEPLAILLSSAQTLETNYMPEQLVMELNGATIPERCIGGAWLLVHQRDVLAQAVSEWNAAFPDCDAQYTRDYAEPEQENPMTIGAVADTGSGGKVALGLGIAATVVGLVYLLFRGRR